MAGPGSQDQQTGGFWRLGSRARTLKAFGILISVLVAAAAFFGFQVYRELVATHHHHLRLLDEAATAVEERIELTLGNVHNLRDEISDDEKVAEFVRRQPFLDLRTSDRWTAKPPKAPPGKVLREAEGCGPGEVTLDSSTLPPSIFVGGCGEVAERSFDLDLEALIQAIVPGEEFSRFLLFDQQGDRLAQLAARGERPFLRTAAQIGHGDEGGAAEALSLGEFPVSRTMSERVRIADLELEIACQPLVVSGRVESNGRIGDRHTWTFCGVVSRPELLRRAVTLSPGWTVTFAIVGLLGLALVPYAKPLFMARRERLTRTDLVFLATGTLLLLQILTVGGLAVFRLVELRIQDGDRLEVLADRVDQGLRSDLAAYHEVLGKLDRGRCEALAVDEVLRSDHTPDAVLRQLNGKRCEAPADFGPFADDESLKKDSVPREILLFAEAPETGDRSEAERLRLGSLLSTDDPLFGSVFWLDETGLQIHKASARERNTAVVKLAHRDYFQRIVDRTGWPEAVIEGTCSAGSCDQVVVDTAFSVTTSRPFFALSRPSACSSISKARVAVLTGVLPLMRSSITPGFGFAVIRGDGTVIASSRPELQPDASFYPHLDAPEEVRAAFASDAPQHLSMDLGRRPHRLFLRPSLPLPFGAEHADGTPRPLDERWWVVTFQDREIPRTLFAEVMVLSLGLCVVYSLFLGLLGFVLRNKLRFLIWPREDHFSLYVRNLLLLLVWLGSVSWIADAWSRLDPRLGFVGPILLCLLPAVGPMAVVISGFSFHRSSGGWAWAEGLQDRLQNWLREQGLRRPGLAAYRVMLLVFWISLAVGPAALFVEAAADLESVSLARHDLRWWERETVERERRLRTEWSQLARPAFVDRRVASTSDRFPILVFNAAEEHGSSSHTLLPLLRLFPTYNTTSQRIRHQWRGPIPTPGEALTGEPMTISRIEPRTEDTPAKWLLLFVLASLMGVVVLWIRFVDRNFGLRLRGSPQSGPPLGELFEETSRSGTGDGGPVGRRIVILTSNLHWAQVRRLEIFEILDLTNPASSEKSSCGDTCSPWTIPRARSHSSTTTFATS